MADQLSRERLDRAGAQGAGESGFTALKAEPLAKAMGVSRGSFYWHFADIGAFHAAISEALARGRGRADHRRSRGAAKRRTAGSAAARASARGSAWRARCGTGPPRSKGPNGGRAIDRRRLDYIEELLGSAGSRRRRREPARKSCTGRFSASRCRTSHRRRPAAARGPARRDPARWFPLEATRWRGYDLHARAQPTAGDRA